MTSTEFVYRDLNLIVTVVEQQMRDLQVVQRVKQEILEAIQLNDIRNVILDLSRVEFVGSVAFLAFLSIRREPGVGRVFVCNLTEPVREVFSLCKLIPGPHNPTAPFEEATSVEGALELLA